MADNHTEVSDSKIALKKLIDGNQRYVNNKLLHPNRSDESREAAAQGQNPFAIILGCSDSRVSPEILFDQGIGDLFVVRVAGNVAGDVELDSIDFSAIHLGSALILVLGHENCGAVNAVLNRASGDIKTIAKLIEPAIAATKGTAGNPLENAVLANIRSVVQQLKNTPVISRLIKEGKLDVVGGYYMLQSGEVKIL